MKVEIIIKGKTRSTQSVTEGIDPWDARRLALAAALKARHITISEALRADFRVEPPPSPVPAKTSSSKS